ncbi:MAG: prepilin-type N-terminal cleavage/methylation domain-containing protein [Candidatus Omnitrophota bacterium]
MKKAFTLIELMIVLIIVGVLASITLPKFTSTIDKAKADQATTYLKVIRTGERIYYTNNYTYVACADAAAIKANLGVEVTTDSYGFAVVLNPNDPSLFSVTATKNGSTEAVYQKIFIDQDGRISKQTEKGCSF